MSLVIKSEKKISETKGFTQTEGYVKKTFSIPLNRFNKAKFLVIDDHGPVGSITVNCYDGTGNTYADFYDKIDTLIEARIPYAGFQVDKESDGWYISHLNIEDRGVNINGKILNGRYKLQPTDKVILDEGVTLEFTGVPSNQSEDLLLNEIKSGKVDVRKRMT